MRCSKAIQQLQFYIDNQLTLDQIRALEAHLSSCTACQEELFVLQGVASALQGIPSVAEPANLTAAIMQRVALSPRRQKESPYILLRPSLQELLAVILLATITTLGVILEQPSLRAVLPLANGHDTLSLAFVSTLHLLMIVNNNTLTLVLWVIGTVLGVCITLALAGDEMRTEWLKAMIDRLPVW